MRLPKTFLYEFFTYYAENCQEGYPDNIRYNTTQDEVTVGITIDGSQDVMHAMAYHSEEQFDEAIDKIRLLGADGDVDAKPLLQYGDELVYSTMSGHRGIHPIFNLNHLLTRLDFMIKGAVPVNSTETDDFRQIVVRKVSVRAPNHGTLMVANDAWTDTAQYRKDVEEGRLLTFGGEKAYLPLVLDTVPATDYFTWLAQDPLYNARYQAGDAQHHVSSTQARRLGKPIMLPPDTIFRVKLDVEFLDVASYSDQTSGNLKGPVRTLNPIEYDIKYPPGGFLPGHAYTVIISVYGTQQINGQLYLNAWMGQTAEVYDGFEGLDENGADIDGLIYIDEDNNDKSDRWEGVTTGDD